MIETDFEINNNICTFVQYYKFSSRSCKIQNSIFNLASNDRHIFSFESLLSSFPFENNRQLLILRQFHFNIFHSSAINYRQQKFEIWKASWAMTSLWLQQKKTQKLEIWNDWFIWCAAANKYIYSHWNNIQHYRQLNIIWLFFC